MWTRSKLLILLLCMLNVDPVHSQGRVVFEGAISSPTLKTNRMIRVYLPASYDRKPDRRFPVLYLHDGQNVFTTAGTNVAFGWGNWQLDKTADEYSDAGKMAEIIMVGIDCSAERYLDYRGPASRLGESQSNTSTRPTPAPGDNTHFEKYSKFLIEELKPKIDREYRTLTDAKNTGVMGSSMGGICSLALAWEHPDVFGKAASISGAYQVEKKFLLNNVLRTYSGKSKPVKIYLDSGVIDFTGGDDGRKNTEAVAAELRRIGWSDGIDLMHYIDQETLKDSELEKTGLRRDKWKEAQTSQHNEFYWRLRAWRPLVFLFPIK